MATVTGVTAPADWGPEFAYHELGSVSELLAADPTDFRRHGTLPMGMDRPVRRIAAIPMFAANLGVPEDEATGSAAMRITDHLSQDLRITQGKGSVLETTWSAEGWVKVAGRVINDVVTQLN